MDDLLKSMSANVPGIVGVLIVVGFFLKAQRWYIEQIREISRDCHERSKSDRLDFQTQAQAIFERQEKMAHAYNEGMKEFSHSIGKNGEILIRMEKALMHTHRRSSDSVGER